MMKNQTLRTSCSSCGSRQINWITVDQLALSPGVDCGDVHRLVEFCGPDADVWLCGICKEFGAFSRSAYVHMN